MASFKSLIGAQPFNLFLLGFPLLCVKVLLALYFYLYSHGTLQLTAILPHKQVYGQEQD